MKMDESAKYEMRKAVKKNKIEKKEREEEKKEFIRSLFRRGKINE